jgi:hypothetical protein
MKKSNDSNSNIVHFKDYLKKRKLSNKTQEPTEPVYDENDLEINFPDPIIGVINGTGDVLLVLTDDGTLQYADWLDGLKPKEKKFWKSIGKQIKEHMIKEYGK